MRKRIRTFLVLEMVFCLLGNYLVIFFWSLAASIDSSKPMDFSIKRLNPVPFLLVNYSNEFFLKILLCLNLLILVLVSYLAFIYENKDKIQDTGLICVTDKIQIPVPAGNGQHGNQHFMNYEELAQMQELKILNYAPGKKLKLKEGGRGGVVVGIKAIGTMPETKHNEEIMYIGEDRHVLMVGATRSGKSRRVLIQSIWLNILAGVNILINDPKGELHAYTSAFAAEHKYNVVTIDFREPNKGNHHNYMQEIVDAVKKDDIAEATDLTWDLVSVLVGEQKGEPIWYNGECSAIAAAILIVATEAPEEYKNLSNVYYFLANMSKPDEFGNMPISRYLETLDETHPARAVFAMAEIAHTKTRGSFFSSALGTLKHFTNPKIAEMTAGTDFSFEQMANEKTVIYIILPDEKETLYKLGSMYIMQHYTYNVKISNQNGGRCPIAWWYLLDEFGQLPYIPPVPKFLSVGAGRGLRFLLATQDFQQIQKIYKDDYNTIKNNCDAWIYLKCSNGDTLKEFSHRCGNYTVQVNSTSISGKRNGGNYSASLTGRELLKPEEVGLIEAPYSLISFAGKFPLMLISPDLSYYYMNEELGLGDENHNRKIIMERSAAREERGVQKVNLWGIWNEFKVVDEYEYEYSEENENQDDRISFLD